MYIYHSWCPDLQSGKAPATSACTHGSCFDSTLSHAHFFGWTLNVMLMRLLDDRMTQMKARCKCVCTATSHAMPMCLVRKLFGLVPGAGQMPMSAATRPTTRSRTPRQLMSTCPERTAMQMPAHPGMAWNNLTCEKKCQASSRLVSTVNRSSHQKSAVLVVLQCASSFFCAFGRRHGGQSSQQPSLSTVPEGSPLH